VRTNNTEFRKYAQRLMTVICEEGLSYVAPVETTIKTPVDDYTFAGTEIDNESIVAVSIIRAADSMLDCFMHIVPECSVGKILIQRNEETAMPEMFYAKLPSLKGKNVVLLDPMVATGGSAIMAIKSLLEQGADEEKITFMCVVACPEGLKSMTDEFPKMTVVVGAVDEGLTAKKYIYPGLGDYGDRFFGTN
jgi:uracil phosphoribosyltransferase